jgi:hypothetical protein
MMHRFHAVGCIPASCCLLLAALPAQAGDAAFSNQTAAAHINATQVPSNLHSFLAGGAVGDFDRDGFQDIYFAGGGGTPDQLLINNGDGTFTNRAAEWGIADTHRSTGAAVGDFDGDGWLDIFITSLGDGGSPAVGKHRLYRNVVGLGFHDVAPEAGVAASSAATPDGWGGAWGDFDLDGDLDLAVAGWNGSSNGNRFFVNNGDGTFDDVTTSIGLASVTGINGFAPRLADMDGDRYPELIWIGDFSTSMYFTNDGDGTFTNFTGGSGTSQDGTEMGFTVADVDRDGDFDMYVTTISSNNLYVNQGNNVYSNVAASAGVTDSGWGWGTVAIDFDHDARVDLVATSQSSGQYAFRNVGMAPLAYDEVSNSIGLVSNVSGRGLSNFDYDNDGDQDLLIFPRADPVQLFRNDVAGPGTGWVRVFLDRGEVTDIAPDGIGSVVTVTTNGGTQVGRIDGGSNYLSQSELSAHFGIGDARVISELRVEWTNGDVTVLTDVEVDQTLTIVAGAAEVPGDVNGDGVVDVADLIEVITAWGPCEACPADLTGDGVVDVADLVEVVLNWS